MAPDLSSGAGMCDCGHTEADHYAGECRRFLNAASVVCSCRGFTPTALVSGAIRPYETRVGTNGYVNGRRDYFAACGCGWLATGWESKSLARASLDVHLEKTHFAPYEEWERGR